MRRRRCEEETREREEKDSRSRTFSSTNMKRPMERNPMTRGTMTEADAQGCWIPPLLNEGKRKDASSKSKVPDLCEPS